MSSKINWLVANTAPGSLVLQPWLIANGISYSLAQKYAKSGWLKKLSAGVYYRPVVNDEIKPDWVDALQALGQQLNLPVYLAGLSSLTHQGLSHYLQLSKERVWVGVKSKQTLPKWFHEFPQNNWVYCGNHKLQLFPETDLKLITIKGKAVMASCPELAAYELVGAIGKEISFVHAAELFQGLVNLSPKKVQSVLERSRSIQTNRVFLYLSHYHGHQWAKRLDEGAIQLGAGKRQVVKKGHYNDRYQITVPEQFHAGKEDLSNG